MLADLRIVAVSRFMTFGALSAADLSDLASLAGPTRWLKRDEHVYLEGDVQPSLNLLLRGWTVSSVGFQGGSRRLLKVYLPGDMLGLPNLALRRSIDTITALTDVQIGAVSAQAIGQLFEINPRLAAILFLISQEERVAAMNRLASIGGTDSVSRVAALIRELHARMRRADTETGDTITVPLRQAHVAELIGVSTMHLNRTIQKLRRDNVLHWERQSVTILDHGRLAELAALPVHEIDTAPGWLPPAVADRR